jgi:hypothetical protein
MTKTSRFWRREAMARASVARRNPLHVYEYATTQRVFGPYEES